ncbi:MAG: hypothetical protein U9Q81_13915 [Pseudomonadota bacterium]|nr:hypothetical protein [Pseudomonadota bacterium]
MTEAQFDLVEAYNTAPQSDWFHYCRETRKPYVVVRTAEQSADVMWDYVTLPPSYDKVLFENGKQIQERAISIFEKHASKESSVRVTSTVVFFDNLSIDRAKLAANELFALIASFFEPMKQPSPQ